MITFIETHKLTYSSEHGIVNSQPELEKWPDSENKSAPGCKEEVLNLRMFTALLLYFLKVLLLSMIEP